MTGFRRWMVLGAAAVLALAVVAAWYYREDILRTSLDPRQPYQVYQPPPAPDYDSRMAWALMPTDPNAPGELAADVFFVHPTTYDGGEHWNAPIEVGEANRNLTHVMLPNYAGPFVRVGRIFAPRYRQASLYTRLTLREDARDARRFAWRDIEAAFETYIARYNDGRPFVIAGVEQGGELAARLLSEKIAADPALRSRLVAAYLIETVVPAADYGPQAPIPACQTREQTGCVVAWAAALKGDAEHERALRNRSLIWTRGGQLEDLAGREPLCVNPLRGRVTEAEVPARENQGATNATDLEWGARPAFLRRQVGATCVAGVLQVTKPKSSAFKPQGSWADKLKAPGFNLFYADIEADAEARVAAFSPSEPEDPNRSADRSAPDR